MNKCVRTKSHTGSQFSKIFFELLYTVWIVVVHLYCGFSPWRQMAPQQSAKFRTAFFGQFSTSLRKDSVANTSIWTLFSTSVTGPGWPKILPVYIVLDGTMLLFLVTGRMPRSGKLPVLNLLTGQNQVFRPARTTGCTDSCQPWQDRRALGSA